MHRIDLGGLQLTETAVPEPSTILIALVGTPAMSIARRRGAIILPVFSSIERG